MAEENPQQIDLPQHEEPQFDWITLHNEMGGTFGMMETNKEKMIRKIKANPFVPVGKYQHLYDYYMTEIITLTLEKSNFLLSLQNKK